ncbi:hypothetical protein ND991_07920 [Gordonia sputi]|uniref:hypothetical protein n=1 Tax=Gordonia sputi TaxID=36823 RepID=UPI002043929B|nr:hypothetical protein [Gordonia sputi]MCM3895133.1 hypothetical protein [Gordonia sputi]
MTHSSTVDTLEQEGGLSGRRPSEVSMGSARGTGSRQLRTRVATALVAAAAVVGGVAFTGGAHADAEPTDVSIVDDVANLPYQALFAAGVQVYEFAGVYRQDSPFSAPYFFTVLRKLHNANQGAPGARRYAFVGRGPGSTLPEAFGMYPGRRPSTDLHLRWTFQFDPRTLTPTLGPIGTLAGGAVATRVCPK